MHVGQACAQAFALRSGTLDLHLPTETWPSYPNHAWFLDFLRAHIHRITNLDLMRVDEPKRPAYYALLASSALERLDSITLTLGKTDDSQSDAAAALRRAPRLRDVYLSNVALPWDALPWGAGLQSVHISRPWYRPAPDSLAALVDCLNRAPALESLHLNMHVSGLEHPPLDRSPPAGVRLPRLQSLTFRGYADDFRALSDALQISPALSLNLTVFAHDHADAEPSALSSLIPTHGRRIEEMHLGSTRSECSVWLGAWPATPNNVTVEGQGSVDVTVELRRSRASMRALGRTLLALCLNFDVQSLRALHLDCCEDKGNYAWDAETWRGLLSLAHNVRSVHIDGAWAGRVLELLSSPVEETAAITCLLPLARDIYFNGPGIRYHGAYDMDLLPDWVAARARLAPVEFLSVSNCPIRQQTVDRLKEIEGLEVEWDGYLWDGEVCEGCEGAGCEECAGSEYGSDYESD